MHSSEAWWAACCALVADLPTEAVEGRAAVALRHLAREHGLSGLASVAVADGRLELPDAVVDGIRQDWAAAMHRSHLLDGVCGTLGRLARRRRLSHPILLKGASVARRYQNPSVRTYVDVDLLVPAPEMPAWAAALAREGYWAPAPDVRLVERRYREGCAFIHPGGGHQVDLHTSLFIERRARDLGYLALAEAGEASCFDGVLQSPHHVQLVVLALHLAHHAASDHRLIWSRDFIEMGAPEVVGHARRFAHRHGVEWALEQALSKVEGLLGSPRWGALAPGPARFGLARAHQSGPTEYLRHAAVGRELGPIAGLTLLASRLDPRRFIVPGRGFDAGAARFWLRGAWVRARRTPWADLWRNW